MIPFATAAAHDPLSALLGSWSAEICFSSILLRLVLAFLLASALGYERANKRHSAGLRTFILVAVGSTTAMLLDVCLGGPFAAVSAATAIGIAIISTYSILYSSKSQIKGLTTAVGLSDGFLISSPSRMWGTLVGLCRGGELLRHVGVSCLETVVGFLAGTLLGTAIAICMWWREGVARVLSPYLVVLNALPKTALGPIFIVWMGAGMGSIIVMTLAISLIVTILSMYQGFLGTDSEKLRLMRSLGATRGQILWMLVFPASFPTLFNTLKVNVGLSWVGVIMGEFLVSRAGLGYLIVYGSQVFNMDLVMASVVILAAAAVVMYRLVLWAEKLLQHYWGVKA